MFIALSSESKLTDRYQTTIPEKIRKALHLNKRDKIQYIVQANGQVLMSRVNDNKNDPVMDSFLNFLATDISNNPQHIMPMNAEFLVRVQALVAGVNIDLDDPLSEEEE